MSAVAAIFDACVLYPAPLRDFLVRLAVNGACRALWSDAIHDEWTRNVLADRPTVTAESLARCRRLMEEHLPSALVAGYDELIPSLTLPDPDDRHVLAAASHGAARFIVTINLRDFPDSVLVGHGIEAIHPDEFVGLLLDELPDLVRLAAGQQRAALRHPPKSVEQFLAMLTKCGLPQSAVRLSESTDGL
jgi:hypothetical protein